MTSRLQLTIAGPDAVGASARLFEVLAGHTACVDDVEQVTIQGQLVLTVHMRLTDTVGLLDDVDRAMKPLGLQVTVSRHSNASRLSAWQRLHVTLLSPSLDAIHLSRVAHTLADAGANIDRIGQLARSPLVVYELLVSGGDQPAVRRQLAALAAELRIDIAVQDDEINRRAKRLVVLDVDSTLVQGEVIDALADRAGVAGAVGGITERAMNGELDFAASLRARVALLRGLTVSALDQVVAAVVLAPGARTMVRTLKQLGYAVGVVSGGFTFATEHLKAELGLDFAEANVLEIRDGVLTGKLIPPIIDRAAKAAALHRFCAELGIDASLSVAVGDGANDLDMLAAAGLGIAFNAKPVVRREAAVSLSSPYLDAVLFLLGLSEREIVALA